MLKASPPVFAGRKLYAPAWASAANQAKLWRTSDPTGAVLMDKLSVIPRANWVGDWEKDPMGWTDRLLTAAAGALCTIVVYNIPHRDCGSLSAGGAKDGPAYTSWVSQIAAGLKGRTAIVILEPDALTLTHCLDAAGLAERHTLLAAATNILTGGGARVYLDAGDSNWVPVEEVAVLLEAAGVAHAAGFATNVSHFELAKNEVTWDTKLRNLLHDDYGIDAHFVYDTGRNGTGPHGDGDNRWCNPPHGPGGVGCGLRPTTATKVSGCDARLWVKAPGDSDGARFGGPDAGKFWPEFARGLAANASPPL